MSESIVVTGIDTDSGKTLVSAILCHGLNADYWKPIQAGKLPHTDSEWIEKVAGISKKRIHPESYLLEEPQSPHASAENENIKISLDEILVPKTDKTLIIEGAGGIMVPLRKDLLLIDLFGKWNFPVVLVSKTYLGSINHSLLTWEALERRNIPIKGWVFNEGGRPESMDIICEYSGLPQIGYVPKLEAFSSQKLQSVFTEHFHI